MNPLVVSDLLVPFLPESRTKTQGDHIYGQGRSREKECPFVQRWPEVLEQRYTHKAIPIRGNQ